MEQVRNEQTIYSAAVYCRLSKDDEQAGESVSIETQVIIYKGGILPPKIYYDCGSFVVNRKAVVGKEKAHTIALNSTRRVLPPMKN